MVADLPEEIFHRVLPVKELPQEDPGRVQAEAMAGIGIKDNGPIVKLLAEQDERIGYRILAVRQHGPCSPFT